MSVKPDQLPSLLERSLAPAYLIAGAEPLLVQECRDHVIRSAQARGFGERTVHDVGRVFDWGCLQEESAAPSLFSSRRIVDLRLPGGKPGNDGSAAIVSLVQAADPDLLLLVSSGEWGTAMRKLKWVTSIAQAGVLVEIWPVRPHQMPDWIRQRMKRAGLNPEPGAVALLAELVEGNRQVAAARPRRPGNGGRRHPGRGGQCALRFLSPRGVRPDGAARRMPARGRGLAEDRDSDPGGNGGDIPRTHPRGYGPLRHQRG
jgi:DNA polymerase-3 subunit delta